MHTAETLRHWMHEVHDGGIKAMHYTGHMFHEKVFWEVIAFMAVIALFFLLATLMNTSGTGTLRYHPFQ